MLPTASFVRFVTLLLLTPALAAAVAPTDVQQAATANQPNQRMQALEGSLSAWSGQFNLLYKGSSLAHPLAAEAPNPGHVVPPPLVTLSGTFSARYRFDPSTTLGLGSGLTTQTPLQGARHTSLADPYVDVARSFNWASMHHRLDVQYTQWTNYEYYNVYGYRSGVSALAESLLPVTGALTLGVQLAADANTFAAGKYQRSQQTLYGFGVYPSLEYRLSQALDFRSVLGIRQTHNRNASSYQQYQHPDVYQTVGVGLTLTRAFYLYAFVKAYPLSRLAADRTLCGFNTIINLF